ncbi:hypothetical protein [Secundilactobacillus kimchicus]|nr:hypothetical protein [Secundilactobacillus kimchicus]
MKLYESKNHHVKISVDRPSFKGAILAAISWIIVITLTWWWLK